MINIFDLIQNYKLIIPPHTIKIYVDENLKINELPKYFGVEFSNPDFTINFDE
jgi:hypothetical protein